MPRDAHESIEMFTYGDLLAEIRDGRSHLLLGNGFSIGCDPVFCYPSLYEAAVESGLSERARSVFARLGTNNFEGAMRLLDDSHWVGTRYGLNATDLQPMLDDVEVIKRALVNAVSSSHLAHTGLVPDAKKASARSFFDPYHNIFTTNYDLLLYWVNMSGSPPVYGDGFREDQPEDETVCFKEHLGDDRGIFHLHGGLHFFVDKSLVRKHCWRRSGLPLTESIQQGLAQSKYPLFVAEGSAELKHEQINANAYLAYCYSKFGRVTNRVVAYGFAFGESDKHIRTLIVRNTDFKQLFVALHGDPQSPPNLRLVQVCREMQEARQTIRAQQEARDRQNGRRRRSPGNELEIRFFDSDSAHVWN